MSKSSRRRQAAQNRADRPNQQAQKSQTVNPVRIGSRKGSVVPKTRQMSAFVGSTEETASIEAPELSAIDLPVDANMPDWLEGYLKYQSEFTRQLADQIVEDHQVLIDHDWRLYYIEDLLGLEPVEPMTMMPEPKSQTVNPAPPTTLESDLAQSVAKPEPQPKAQSKSEPEPEPKPEPKMEPAPQPELAPEPAPKPEPKPEPKMEFRPKSQSGSEPIPREMYEAWCFENAKWRLRGPYKRISQAEQAARGDLSKVRIVQVWWDPEKDIVCGYLSAEQMERYL